MEGLLYKDECYQIQGAIFKVYKELGCGHKEIVYENSLVQLLIASGYQVEKQKRISVFFNGKKVGTYTPDLVINSLIMVELKAKTYLTQQDIQQFWKYLTATDYKLGLLVNFGKPGGVEIIRKVYDTARNKQNKQI